MARTRSTAHIDDVRNGSYSERQVELDAEGKRVKPTAPSKTAQEKRIRSLGAVSYLTFKYLLNRMINLRDEQMYSIPTKLVEKMTSRGPATVPDFDMEFIHKIQLRDEKPNIPPRTESMSEAYFLKIEDAAQDQAVRNRASNDMVRYLLDGYVQNGTIEIIDDPFNGRQVTSSEFLGALNLLGKQDKE